MQVDKFGNARLIDRDTGKPHVCSSASAREILDLADPSAHDGDPRYVLEAAWDGLLAKDAKKAKAEAAKAAAAEAKRVADEQAEAERAAFDAKFEAEFRRRQKAGTLPK